MPWFMVTSVGRPHLSTPVLEGRGPRRFGRTAGKTAHLWGRRTEPGRDGLEPAQL